MSRTATPDARGRIAQILLGYDYVGGVFVDDKYGAIPGTLPLSGIGLVGATTLPAAGDRRRVQGLLPQP